MTRDHLDLGAAGEEQAARWYERKGYVVLDRNWRCKEGELDLVTAAPDGTLVFSEVKTRRSTRFGTPAEAVTADKQRRLRTLAAAYLRENPASPRRGPRGPGHGGLRFDVVAILNGKIEVIEGAF